MCGDVIEKTTENSDIIHEAEPPPDEQENGAPGGPAAKAALPPVGVPFLNHHPIFLPLETFLVGTGEREGEEKVGTVFPNSADHFTFF